MERLIHAYLHGLRFLESLMTLEPDRRISKLSSLRLGQPVGLRRCQRLLQALGNPEQQLRFIHVTGTSGKGSLVTLLQTILHRAGYRVGAHLSPHVTTPLERITWQDGLLPLELFVSGLEVLKPFIEEEYRHGPFGVPSYQEILLGIALRAFVLLQAELVVLEVGIGGRLDSTNVIPPPLLAVVTEVGLDHVELLGHDIGSIARDKAGIFKPGSFALTGSRRVAAREALEERAAQVGIPLWRLGHEVRIQGEEPRAFGVHWPGGGISGLRAGLSGGHQRQNGALAAAAVGALRAQGLTIPDEAVRQGLLEVFLPGRFEVVDHPAGTLVLDLAHNPDKVASVVQTWLERLGPGGAAVVAASADKDAGTMLQAVGQVFSPLFCTRPLGVPRAMIPPLTLASRARELGLLAEVRLDPQEAVRDALAVSGGRALVTGSTYLVGEVRRALQSEEAILRAGRVAPILG